MLIFTLYLLLAMAWLYRFSGWERRLPARSGHWLLWISLARVGAGCWFGWYYRDVPDIDTWYYHNEGLKYYELLKSNPVAFWRKDLLDHGYSGGIWNNMLGSSESFFNDLQQNLVIKFCALLDVLSGGDYYTNVLLTNVLTTWGLWYGFRWWQQWMPQRPLLTLLVLGFYPPLLHFSSPLMKDGLCMALLFGMLYQLSGFIRQKIRSRLMAAGLFAFLLMLLRPAMAFGCLPLLLLLLPAGRRWTERQPVRAALAVVAGLVILFGLSGGLSGSLNLPAALAARQQSFQALEGGSRLTEMLLQPGFDGYLSYWPVAFKNVHLEPWPWTVRSWGAVAAFMSTFMGTVSAAYLLLKGKRLSGQPAALLLFAVLSMGMLQYLIIGFTVPFLGAILRYRAVYETLAVLMAAQLWLTRKKED